MVNIKRQMASQTIINQKTSGKGNKMTHICIHETANTAQGANANAHANLQSNKNSRDASWHYQVDEDDIIQSFEDNIKCWHAGSKGNPISIGIEICVNKGENFAVTLKNAAELTKHLMKKYNIPLKNVVQHNYFTGKDCPRFLRDGSKGFKWADFVNMLSSKDEVDSKPTQPTQNKPEGDKNMKMSELLTASQMKQLEDAYRKAFEKGHLSSDEWYKKVANKSIMLHEVAYLNAILWGRSN